jgi:hypothetical protein
VQHNKITGAMPLIILVVISHFQTQARLVEHQRVPLELDLETEQELQLQIQEQLAVLQQAERAMDYI